MPGTKRDGNLRLCCVKEEVRVECAQVAVLKTQRAELSGKMI